MSKISICMIVGNVEGYIQRCLTSFLPFCDELCIVTAIGSQYPDRTLQMAVELCALHNKPIRVGKYVNRPGHEDWPHVDDFAAARQLSFDLSTSDYCLWVDSDDVLESGGEHLRELADRGGYAAFIFPYRIFGRGVVVPRERLLLKTSGRWRYPVHECFDFLVQPVQAVEDERVVITHMPDIATKTGSNERNLRILKSIPESEMSAGMLFHLSGELGGAGDIGGCIKATHAALAHPDLGKAERYDLLLNLAFKTKEHDTLAGLLHAAYAADPCRREALYLLCNNALNHGNNEIAMAYARQMMATPSPAVKDWNHRHACYGHAGDDMWMQALRANGFSAQAEGVRRETLKAAGGPRIALLHATRGRPQQASQARKVWLDMADRPEQVEHIFVFDDDDKDSFALSRMHHFKTRAGGGCVAAWNSALFVTEADVVVQMSDDWLPPMKWDELILQRIGDVKKPVVLAVSDGSRRDDLLCMAICTREYARQDNFFFHPWFTGVYSDNWFTKVAYERGAVIEARDLVFHHQHPAFGKSEPDATYAAQNAPERYIQGKAVFDELCARRDWSSVPGFFNYWGFYRYVAGIIPDGANVVEVGVWLGRSIIFLAQELKIQGKHNVKLHAVDHFKGESNQKEHEATVRAAGGSLRDSFYENIRRCGVDHMISVHDGQSDSTGRKWQGGPLDFCFIDAAHDYDSVLRDVKAWLPHVKPGGIFAGHDADHDPVLKAVNEVLGPVTIAGSIWFTEIKK